ncbi:MAG TPA: glutamine--tRNA ligase/YqeY domain fusion protein [Phycisphaerales bacterium]|nr:glutamine--tRNA ligase/YqeY domain fusion protein [Phycisphaerales bacterium]
MASAAENTSGSPSSPDRPLNFIEQMVEADIASHRWGLGKAAQGMTAANVVQTRFPPEPNGNLHVGHAESICLNYGLAQKYGGKFNLRFDDTNPSKEEQEYVDAIKKDVAWLTSAFGGSYDDGPHAGGVYWASDYFGKMYEFAQDLIRKKKAYVCELSAEEVAKRRGTPSVPATSPFRDRPVEESLRLFQEMKEGKHPDGSMTLRARIDLASPNFNLRDPVMYRILHEEHHNTGREWCVYAMYDWAHGIEDGLEKVTHSICTLEFENHRPLYDWFIAAINEGRKPEDWLWHSQQIEFAKLQFTYTVLSKRNMRRMVEEKFVNGWDDPRMPTISAMRRRGYPARALRALCEDVGVTKVESVIDIGRLENAVRHELNRTAPRAMCVLRPLKVVIENWPAGKVDELEFVVNPEDPSAGKRKVAFTGELYIEREDFMEVPEKKFFRLAPGAEVRLRWAYFIKCVGVDKDAAGNVVAVRCTYDPATRGGDAPLDAAGKPTRKVKGTLHWVSAAHAIGGEVRLFERLFAAEAPGEKTGKWEDDLNPSSLEVLRDVKLDPVLEGAKAGETFQFERMGYFCVDPDSSSGKLVFNRTVTLKESK